MWQTATTLLQEYVADARERREPHGCARRRVFTEECSVRRREGRRVGLLATIMPRVCQGFATTWLDSRSRPATSTDAPPGSSSRSRPAPLPHPWRNSLRGPMCRQTPLELHGHLFIKEGINCRGVSARGLRRFESRTARSKRPWILADPGPSSFHVLRMRCGVRSSMFPGVRGDRACASAGDVDAGGRVQVCHQERR